MLSTGWPTASAAVSRRARLSSSSIDADAQRGGTRSVQAHAGEGERDGGPVERAAVQRGQQRGVQRGVQQRGMGATGGGVAVAGLGQRDLGQPRVAVAPGRPQPLEGRAVAVAGVGQRRVEVLHVDLLRVGRRPHRQAGGQPVCVVVLGRGQDAGGVQPPRLTVLGRPAPARRRGW